MLLLLSVVPRAVGGRGARACSARGNVRWSKVSPEGREVGTPLRTGVPRSGELAGGGAAAQPAALPKLHLSLYFGPHQPALAQLPRSPAVSIRRSLFSLTGIIVISPFDASHLVPIHQQNL